MNDLNSQLHYILQGLVDNATFFAFPFNDIGSPILPVACRVACSTIATAVADKSLDAAIETSVNLLREWRIKPLYTYGPGSWTSFFHSATARVLEAAGLSHRLGFEQHSYDSLLYLGGRTSYDGCMYKCWAADNLVKSPGHWSCIMCDTTAWYGPGQDGTAAYCLRSELITCVALLSRQIEQMQGASGVHHSSVKATVVTFTPSGARVMQASVRPSSALLVLTFQGTYDPSDPTTGYSSESTRSILQWIVQPNDPWTPASEDARGSQESQTSASTKASVQDSEIGVADPIEE